MGAVASQPTNMDSKVLLILYGLCLSCYAAPFNPLATANNWVASVSNAQNLPVNALLQTSVSRPLVYAAPTPMVRFAPQVVNVGTPVFKAAAVASPVLVAEAPEPLDAPNPPMPTRNVPFVGGQFHAQDEMGQYAFGHHGGSNTRVETRDFLGRVTGSFAYANPEGDVHVRKYAAASGMGFKVAGSDIPVDTPEVAAAKATLAEAFATHSDAIATAKAASAKATETASSS